MDRNRRKQRPAIKLLEDMRHMRIHGNVEQTMDLGYDTLVPVGVRAKQHRQQQQQQQPRVRGEALKRSQSDPNDASTSQTKSRGNKTPEGGKPKQIATKRSQSNPNDASTSKAKSKEEKKSGEKLKQIDKRQMLENQRKISGSKPRPTSEDIYVYDNRCGGVSSSRDAAYNRSAAGGYLVPPSSSAEEGESYVNVTLDNYVNVREYENMVDGAEYENDPGFDQPSPVPNLPKKDYPIKRLGMSGSNAR